MIWKHQTEKGLFWIGSTCRLSGQIRMAFFGPRPNDGGVAVRTVGARGEIVLRGKTMEMIFTKAKSVAGFFNCGISIQWSER